MAGLLGLVWLRFRPNSGSESKISGRILMIGLGCPLRGGLLRGRLLRGCLLRSFLLRGCLLRGCPISKLSRLSFRIIYLYCLFWPYAQLGPGGPQKTFTSPAGGSWEEACCTRAPTSLLSAQLSRKVSDRHRNTPTSAQNLSESLCAALWVPCRMFWAWFGPV